MQHAHYRLTDGALLGRLMRCPDPSGTRHTLRSLAVASGLSKSKIGYMLHDRQTLVTGEQAEDIATAVGVQRKALFTPQSFAFANGDTEGDPRGPDRAHTPRPTRGAHQLGEDPGSGQPDG